MRHLRPLPTIRLALSVSNAGGLRAEDGGRFRGGLHQSGSTNERKSSLPFQRTILIVASHPETVLRPPTSVLFRSSVRSRSRSCACRAPPSDGRRPAT